MVDARSLGLEWSKAYVLASSRRDKQSMLYLLGLVSWPPLTCMYGDLVDDLTLICTLLSKKPMVGYLVARRLQLEEEKTYALLSVLEAKGYIKAVGSHLQGDPYVFNSAHAHPDRDSFKRLHAPRTLASGADNTRTEAPEPADTAAVLKQLWRVLNTDISFNRGVNANAKANANANAEQTTADTQAETSDVLGQLWRVLNTDIVLKKPADSQTAADVPVTEQVHTEAETADVMSQLWRVLNTEIAFKRQTAADQNDKADVTGEAAAVMSQLWRVLNTEIAFKRKTNRGLGASVDTTPEADTGHEAADRLSQLWRVLNTEIALKKQSHVDAGLDEATGTTGEASDRLTQLWRILNAEITVTLPPDHKK